MFSWINTTFYTYVRVWAADSYDVVIFNAAILPTPQNALALQAQTISLPSVVCRTLIFI